MCTRVAIVYNEPHSSRYDFAGEEKAVTGILHAVSAVHRALLELGCHVALVALSPPIEQARIELSSLKADLVFNLFEGFCGYPETEAWLPEYLAELGMPYTGSPGAVLGLALDKAKVKVILRASGILTPDFQLLNHHTLHMFKLGYPCIVKPRSEDASHGLTEESVVSDFSSLEKQVKRIHESYGGSVLVEKFINGREYNATVLGNFSYTVLPVSEIEYSLPAEMPRILTFAAKWQPDSQYYKETRVVCPARIDAEDREIIGNAALAAFRILNCRGYARVDIRMDGEGQLNVIEVNPNPDISPDSGAAKQVEAAGMTYTQFIERTIKLALGKEYYDKQDTQHVRDGQAGLNENTAEYTRIQTV